MGCPTGIEMLTRMAAVKLAFEDNENMRRGEDRGGQTMMTKERENVQKINQNISAITKNIIRIPALTIFTMFSFNLLYASPSIHLLYGGGGIWIIQRGRRR